jgi:hypothetical protein
MAKNTAKMIRNGHIEEFLNSLMRVGFHFKHISSEDMDKIDSLREGISQDLGQLLVEIGKLRDAVKAFRKEEGN